jgi:type I restriction enzyme R subunit
LEVYDKSRKLRKPDLTLYLNGLPVVVCEIKKPLADEKVEAAYHQNLTLSEHNPDLFAFNVLNFLSDNINTKYGNVFAPLKYYAG